MQQHRQPSTGPSDSGVSTRRTSGPVERLCNLAATKHGVVTVEDAQQCGLTRAQTRTLVDSGQWLRPRRGILVASSAPPGWLQDAAVAAAVTDGVLSHRAAVVLHRLDGVSRAPIELLVGYGQNRPQGPWIIHRTATLASRDIVIASGIPTTSMARTVVDVGAVVSDDVVEQILDDAQRRGLTNRQLTKTLERLHIPNSPGSTSLARVLSRPDRQGPLPHSKFERLVQRACVAGGLPMPKRQHKVRDENGRLIAQLDLAWPEAMLGVEADSVRFHSSAAQIRSDNRRDLLLMGAGWEICYFGWQNLADPDAVTRLLRATYERRVKLLGG